VSAASTDALAAAGFGALLALVWVAGSALAPAAPPAERLAAGLLAFVAAGVLAMAQPLARASVLGRPWLVGILALSATAALVAWRRPPLRPSVDWGAAAPPAAIGVAVMLPALVTPTDAPGGDMLWHAGWIRQLTGGLLEPGALYADVPNAYPWLYHALAALVAAFPGGVGAALLVVETVMLLALATGAWLLARELGLDRGESRWGTALALACGGFGWLWSLDPEPIVGVTPQNVGRYGGDLLLVPASGVALGNVPPALPRELGLALVPLAVFLAARAARTRSDALAAVAGATAGAGFLVAPPAGVVAAASCAAVVLARGRGRALAPAAVGFAAAALVWVAPAASRYADLGGYVRTSAVTPVAPSPTEALVALGLLVPLGAAGLVLARSRRDVVRPAASLAGVALAAAALAVLLPAAGSLPAFTGGLRYLPYVGLALALPAGVAAAAIGRRAGRPAAAAVAALAFLSPALAVVAETGRMRDAAPGIALRCAGGIPIRAGETVAAIPPTEQAAVDVFTRTGAFLLYSPRPRIRYRDVTYRRPTQVERRAASAALARGGPAPAAVTWVLAPPGTPIDRAFEPVGRCRADRRALVLLRRAPA
jgi:hypothetical protein